MSEVKKRVASGLDRVAAREPEALRALGAGPVGLLAHPASVDRQLRPAVEVLEGVGCEVAVLFGPEHGFAGYAQDMVGVSNERVGGRPVFSLYGASAESLSPTASQLRGLRTLLIDLQDVGSRYYTYVWTAALAMRAAAACGVRTVVLDRPNPLGGRAVEGGPQAAGFESFVGLYPVSVRHGMTLGEMMRMVADVEGLVPDALEVVTMSGWHRDMLFDQTGLPWVSPSPNMPTLETAWVYPGGCLLEGTQLSEGRGLTRPFEVWGAPALDAGQLARTPLEGAILRPLTFKPQFQKHAGALCQGVQVHVRDRLRFRPFAAYARLIYRAARLLGDGFAWRGDAYEFVEDIPAIDLLTGGRRFRALVEGGSDAELEAWLREQAAQAAAFDARRKAWLMYPGGAESPSPASLG